MKKPRQVIDIRAVPRCTVCRHPDRKEIDYSIAGGAESNRCIAIRFGLQAGAIQRHRNNHVKPAIQRAIRKAEGHEEGLKSVWETRLDETWGFNHQGAARAAASDKFDWVAGARFLSNMGKLCEVGLRADGVIDRRDQPNVNIGQVILLPQLTEGMKTIDLRPQDLSSSEDD